MKRCGLALVFAAGVAAACGGSGSSVAESPTAPQVSTGTGGTGGPGAVVTPTECTTFGDRKVTLNRTVAQFTAAPFNASELRLITNGEETADARFAYIWVKESGGSGSANIYAPADGALIRIRHKVPNAVFDSNDWDFFFLAACDPTKRTEGDTIFRFNHITHPRADLLAAYAFGSLPAPEIEPVFNEHEERQVPLVNITVRAGELLGSTRGTPTAHDFDFTISILNATVCPFEVLPEPHKSALLGLLGPGPQGPNRASWGLPQPGFPCRGYGAKP